MSQEPIYARQLGQSSVSTRKSKFLWKISNASHLRLKFRRLVTEFNHIGLILPIRDVVVSPVFSTTVDDLKWSLVLFGTSSIFGNQLGFEFRSMDSRFFEIDVNLTITIAKSNGSDKIRTNLFLQKSSTHLYRGFITSFVTVEDLFVPSNGYLRNDELQIWCEYELVPDYVSKATTNQMILDKGDAVNC